MTFCSTLGQPWVETLPTTRGASFTGRTFCRFHMAGDPRTLPTVGEIWATTDHAVDGHAHDSDEMLYVLQGSIEVNGRIVQSNEAVFIPRGESYQARVVSDGGSHVLHLEFPNAAAVRQPSEYDSRIWQGPLAKDGFPDVGSAGADI